LDRLKRFLKGQSEEEQAADYRRSAEERFEERSGPAIDDSTLRSMQPLLDSLQHMTGPVPEGDGYAGYSESGDIPFSVRPEDPQIASGEALGLYFEPSQQQQENIVIDPEGSDPRFTAMHEIGHAVHRRNPKGERGWLSPELREAIENREAPFDTEGRHHDAKAGDEPHQRVADYVGEAIDFLQTSKNSAIDPEYTRQYLSERPHLRRVTEKLLQLPIYQEHPLLTGSLGEDYEPETELPETGLVGVSYSDLMGRASDGGGQSLNPVTGQHEGLPDISSWEKGRIEEERIDELVRRIDMGMGGGFQEGDTDAIWDAVSERLDAMKQRKGGESYTSRFLPAS
jgi:hypothetical protein